MRLLVCFIFIVGARLQFDCWPFELFEVQSCSNSRYFVGATLCHWGWNHRPRRWMSRAEQTLFKRGQSAACNWTCLTHAAPEG